MSVVDDTQIDVVARLGDACAISLITSFTSGEYWASYPDRLTEAVYFDEFQDSVIAFGGNLGAPCQPVEGLSWSANGAVVWCGSGLYYSAQSTAWTPLDTLGVVSAAAVSGAGDVIAQVGGAPSCVGIQFRTFASSSALAGVDGGCLEVGTTLPSALSIDGQSAWGWVGDHMYASSDLGTTWREVS